MKSRICISFCGAAVSGSAFFHISRVIFAKKLENRTVLRYNPLEVRKEWIVAKNFTTFF